MVGGRWQKSPLACYSVADERPQGYWRGGRDPSVPPTLNWWKIAGLPVPVAEHKFHPTRKWRFDYAWPDRLVALEVEGGVWAQGRHTRGSGFVKDMEKYNAAAALGWRVLRALPRKNQRGVPNLSPEVLAALRSALGEP